jgi:4-amino-4-deoxy-L-arabinose transferase-like glycosyltransferase
MDNATAAAILGISEVSLALLSVLASFLVFVVAYWGFTKVFQLFGGR